MTPYIMRIYSYFVLFFLISFCSNAQQNCGTSIYSLESCGGKFYQNFELKSTIPFNDNEGNVITKSEYSSVNINVYKPDGVLDKPFIIFNGFNIFTPIDKRKENFIAIEYSLIASLLTRDYDVILVDYVNPTDFIQRNAMCAVEAIDWVNKNKIGLNRNIVMGFSMGGLVARYALSYMEKNIIPTHTAMYVSHDAPHKGANVSLGLQEAFGIMKQKGIAGQFLTNFSNLLGVYTPAVKQMLVYHSDASTYSLDFPITIPLQKKAAPHPKKVAFFNELKNLNPDYNGYPSKLKKIAVANGSYKGTDARQLNNLDKKYTNSEQLLKINYKQVWQKAYQTCSLDFWGWIFLGKKFLLCENPVDAIIYDFGIKVNATFNSSYLCEVNYFDEIFRTYFKANKEYDFVAGSYNNYFNEIAVSAPDIQLGNTNSFFGINKVSFIPTFSALDINNGTEYTFDNTTLHFNESPFDKFNAEEKNLSHAYLSGVASKFIRDETEQNEIVTADEYVTIEGRTLDQNRKDFQVATKKVVSGSEIYTVKAGSGLQVFGGEEVYLTNITVENGAWFEMEAKPVNRSMQKDKNLGFYPHWVYPYIPSGARDEAHSNRIESDTVTLNSSEFIKIYPNPSTGVFIINFHETENHIQIINLMGSVVFEQIYYQTEVQIDLSNLIEGIYIAKIKNKTAISNHKINIKK